MMSKPASLSGHSNCDRDLEQSSGLAIAEQWDDLGGWFRRRYRRGTYVDTTVGDDCRDIKSIARPNAFATAMMLAQHAFSGLRKGLVELCR